MENNKLAPVRLSAFDKVREYDNSQLRALLKELHKICSQDAPRYFKQSGKMKELFKLEKSDYYGWVDQLSNIETAIKVEILYRVRTDAW
jgi:hypothetical protein